MTFSVILVCVDGSESSMKAADYAIKMAKKHEAQLISLYVVVSQLGYAYSSGAFGLVTPSAINELLDKSKQEARKWFDEIEKKAMAQGVRSEEHTSELQSRQYLVCRLLLEKKKKQINY